MDFSEIEVGTKYVYDDAGLRFIVLALEKLKSAVCVKLLDEINVQGHPNGLVGHMAAIGEIWTEPEMLQKV